MTPHPTEGPIGEAKSGASGEDGQVASTQETPARRSRFETLSVERTTTAARVAEELRRAVFEGDLVGGTPLREVALTEHLGVSRSTVREALGMLVAEGIAVRQPNRGVAVFTPDPSSIRDVIRARTVLECAGVRHWPHAAEGDRERLRTAAAAYGDAVARGGGYQELNERHLAVHLAFVGLLGSERLVTMAEHLSSELKVALAQVDRMRRNAHDQAGTHAGLVAQLDRGEVDAVHDELAHHLDDAEKQVLHALGLD